MDINNEVTGNDLKIGDVVKLLPIDPKEPFTELTVVQIKDNQITFFRPYVHLGNFLYTGGVLHYVGTSSFTIPVNHCSYIRIINIFTQK